MPLEKETAKGRLTNYGGGVQIRIPTCAARVEPYGLVTLGYGQRNGTLTSESGASLRGAGWRVVGQVRPGHWSRPQLGRMRQWQPIYGQQKFRSEATA